MVSSCQVGLSYSLRVVLGQGGLSLSGRSLLPSDGCDERKCGQR